MSANDWQDTIAMAASAIEDLLETADEHAGCWADVPARLRALTAPLVPEEAYYDDCPDLYPSQPDAWAAGYNDCRAAMLNHTGDTDNMVKAAPAVLELITEDEQEEAVSDGYADSFRGGWNACRAAMLDGSGVLWSGFDPAKDSSDAIPDGWKLVPVGPTEDMLAAGRTLNDSQLNMTPRNRIEMVYRAMLAAAPEGGND